MSQGMEEELVAEQIRKRRVMENQSRRKMIDYSLLIVRIPIYTKGVINQLTKT
jgi:hypothetical protein